jgi:hypothetical protein
LNLVITNIRLFFYIKIQNHYVNKKYLKSKLFKEWNFLFPRYLLPAWFEIIFISLFFLIFLLYIKQNNLLPKIECFPLSRYTILLLWIQLSLIKLKLLLCPMNIMKFSQTKNNWTSMNWFDSCSINIRHK